MNLKTSQQQVYQHGWKHREITELASGFVVMVGVYLSGALIYVGQYPERLWPGRFDIVGHSHQIWHLFVTWAAVVHYSTLHEYLEYRTKFGCAAKN